MATPDLNELTKKLQESLKDKIITCPNCHTEMQLAMVPQLQKQTVFTVAYILEEGHMLQAVTIGDSIAAMGRLLRTTAKHIGGNVEVMVNDARFTERKIEFDFLIIALPAPDTSTPPKANKPIQKKKQPNLPSMERH